MSKPHVHAELIKAWADGAEIEILCDDGDWRSLVDCSTISWARHNKYRIKPDPFAPFKEALARGERVDMRVRGLAPGCGWIEVPPSFDFKGAPAMDFRVALPWQDERDAYDRGETIEFWSTATDGWRTVVGVPMFHPGVRYRVKPKTTTETFHVGALMQWSPEPHDGIALKPSPFHMPTIELDISYADGEVTNITLKDWKP